jgi:hypothetical protein
MEWEPLSFKMVSTICQYNLNDNFYSYLKIICQSILESWSFDLDLNKIDISHYLNVRTLIK